MDDIDQVLRSLDARYESKIQAEPLLSASSPAENSLAADEGKQLTVPFKTLDGRAVGGFPCTWEEEPSTFRFGFNALRFRFPVWDLWRRHQRGLVTVCDYRDEPISFIWARPRYASTTGQFFWFVNVDQEAAKMIEGTGELAGVIIKHLAGLQTLHRRTESHER